MADPPGFEPGFEAPEASMISKLHYESVVIGLTALMRDGDGMFVAFTAIQLPLRGWEQSVRQKPYSFLLNSV